MALGLDAKFAGLGAARGPSALARASLLRHLAICLATVAAWALRAELHVTSRALWVLGLAAMMNMATARLADTGPGVRFASLLSPVLGLCAWAALIFLTGGITSPMVAGLWLEVVFAAIVFPPKATLLVTGSVVATLWAQNALARNGSCGRLCLETGFLSAFGLLVFFASRRWKQEHQTLSVATSELGQRLRELERELESARALGHVGERVARLAHSLKNAVHSLRGFAKLIEAHLSGNHAEQVLDGLRLAIDSLEQTARATLLPYPATDESGPTSASELSRTLEEVVDQMARVHAGVRWVRPPPSGLASVALPSSRLREVLLILAQNAAEASGASGEVVLKVDVVGNLLHLVIEDQGPGFEASIRETLFQPGITSKPTGSGFGLFLARRLVESGGGHMTVGPAAHGGALVSVSLPVLHV